MAYNSDGYIMIDFAEVDFSKTNQTIEGLFERCQKVIGTNKFVIVINANNKTPLPSTVCITNGQYVIESVLFTFSINSADNLHITKKTTPEELIDDNHITLKTTWSSNKIVSELDKKQDTLTPGDNITINNGVISANGVKSFTYTGEGTIPRSITFPTTPTIVLGIYRYYGENYTYLSTFMWGFGYAINSNGPITLNSSIATRTTALTYNGNELTMEGESTARSMNILGQTYTVYYI